MVNEVVKICLEERITTSTTSFLLIFLSLFCSFKWDKTIIESFIDNPIRPTAPTKLINPKFACPITSPINANPKHMIATLNISIVSRKEFNAEIKAMPIKIKKIVADENIWLLDSDLSAASPETSILYP